MSRFVGWLTAVLRVYQLLVSPWLGPACRFEPSCSQYAIEAIERYGPVRGCWRAAKRLARCHPLGDHGFDPLL
jgi:putative membrane protein insertion efficiency factor